jgi:hypothetical protein
MRENGWGSDGSRIAAAPAKVGRVAGPEKGPGIVRGNLRGAPEDPRPAAGMTPIRLGRRTLSRRPGRVRLGGGVVVEQDRGRHGMHREAGEAPVLPPGPVGFHGRTSHAERPYFTRKVRECLVGSLPIVK